jgi:hypothetical protein
MTGCYVCVLIVQEFADFQSADAGVAWAPAPGRADNLKSGEFGGVSSRRLNHEVIGAGLDNE